MVGIAINAYNFAFILINNATNVLLDLFAIRLLNQTLTAFYSKNQMSLTLIISIGHIGNDLYS